jgi:Uma2 family endonuclease
MKTGQKVFVSDYLNEAEGPLYEIICGEKIMTPAPLFEHQNISKKLFRILDRFVEDNNLGTILYAPFDVFLDAENVVQPDILFISNENLDKIKGQFWGAPDLVIEIISSSSKYLDTVKKKDLYQRFAVKEYWLVDPKYRNIEIFTLDENNNYYLHAEEFIDELNPAEKKVITSKLFDKLEITLNNIFNGN